MSDAKPFGAEPKYWSVVSLQKQIDTTRAELERMQAMLKKVVDDSFEADPSSFPSAIVEAQALLKERGE
jgi:hypothetical protein